MKGTSAVLLQSSAIDFGQFGDEGSAEVKHPRCNQVWTKFGGQIPWNVTPICETSQICYLMGRRPMKDVFGQPFKGPIIPFGSLVEYHILLRRDQSRIHQFGKKVLPGFSSDTLSTRRRIWKGDVLVADLEELETMDASENHSRRLNAKEMIFPKQREFYFSNRRWKKKTLGGDLDLRTSTLVRPRPIQGESNIDFLGESEGSLPQPHDSHPDAGESINDFWSMSGSFIYRHHVEPRVKLNSPREESFPIPLKYIVSRTTHTNLDVKQEKRIDDYWNIWWLSRLVWSLDRFHTIHSIGRKSSRRIYLVRGEINEKQLTSRPRSFMGQNSGTKWERMPSWRRSKSGHMTNSMLRTHENYEGSISLALMRRSSKKPSRMLVRNWKRRWLLLCLVQLWRRIVGSGASNKINSKLACILEADESTRMRMGNSIPPNHEDHIAGKKVRIHYSTTTWFTNLFLCLTLGKFRQRKQRWTREWEKLEKISAWNLTKVKIKKEIIDEARTSGAAVHFASLMAICHLKNAELEAKHQKYKGRVVLRGDIVKDNSGSYAVFTKQGSSASQMTAAKVVDIISRLPGWDGQAADAVSAETQVKMEDVPTNYWKFQNRNVQTFGFVFHDTNGPNHGPNMEDPVGPLERNLCGHPLAGLLWERQLKILLKHGWEKVSYWECLFVHTVKKDYSHLCMWMT